MVDEGAIRKALLSAQEDLVVAFGAGPSALDVYFSNFEALKKQIIQASQLGLLSKETMQLAADVVGGIPAMAQSFMALEQGATRALSKIGRNTRDHPIVCGDDEDDDEDSCDSSMDSDASSEDGAEETDLDEEKENSDTEDDGNYSSSDGESYEDDDHPLAPQWHLLRDWLLDNIGHPFAYNESEYADLLKRANVSFAAFQHWLGQMREHMHWDKLIRNCSDGDQRKWKTLLTKGNEAELPPALQAVISRTKDRICETYEMTIPLWWEQSVSLLANMEDAIWLGATENTRSSSHESSSDDECGSPLRSGAKLVSELPVSKVTDACQPRASLAGVKRKAVEMWASELPEQHFLHFDASYNAENPVTKRRKRDNSEISSWLPPAKSETSPSTPGSSRATSYPLSAGPSSPASLSSSSNTQANATEARSLSNYSSPPSLIPTKVSHTQSEFSAFLATDTVISSSIVLDTSTSLRKVNPQVQILTGTSSKLVPPYIRSETIPFDRKRKRKVKDEDYIISPPKSDPSIPPKQPTYITQDNIDINSKPITTICSKPYTASLNDEVPDQPPPNKRLRPNSTRSCQSTIYKASLRKYKSDRQQQRKRSSPPSSQTVPPAKGLIKSVATSPCHEQSKEADDDNKLLKALEEINPTGPMPELLELMGSRLSPGASIGSFDPYGQTETIDTHSQKEADDSYHHLLEAATPSLSAASPNDASPYSSADIATPATTAISPGYLHAANDDYTYSSQNSDNPVPGVYFEHDRLGVGNFSFAKISGSVGSARPVEASARSSTNHGFRLETTAWGNNGSDDFPSSF
ncbi:hypothetical protein M408DRAFT_332782 [Serendipita vermifera MAFF 305830]|uniref:Homeobox KN domain-containing protein n=1 Tax=Serendipita vermifera MAFF 305830 TaxID=933852 RepID=A0A0C2WZM4_SERVB|nr:hypothetical protein M408DRAFT_332782 [Serendipita vermifera MAFF 305830]